MPRSDDPKTGKVFVRLELELLRALEDLAKEEGRKNANMARRLIEEALWYRSEHGRPFRLNDGASGGASPPVQTKTTARGSRR